MLVKTTCPVDVCLGHPESAVGIAVVNTALAGSEMRYCGSKGSE